LKSRENMQEAQKQKRISRLMEKAFSLLDAGELKGAEKIGRELKKLRHSSAFEILALAYLRQQKPAKAVNVLEEGTRKAGKVWLLWELLGNCYSDLGRFRDAETAYQRALQQKGCDPSVVHLNRAIAFERNGRSDAANLAVRQVKSKNLRRRADAIRIRLALVDGKKRTAKQLASRTARRRPNAEERYDRETESAILLSCALAFQKSPAERKQLIRLAVRAVDLNPNNTEALALIREARARKARHSRQYALFIHGRWNTPLSKAKAPPGFFRTIRVVAPTEKIAFQYAKQFFPTPVRKMIGVEKYSFTDGDDLNFEGVYYLSGYSFYDRRGAN
jgi:tetratricopeptide (TPR) repeat protein